jgi:hypothetical protein
MDYPPPPNKIRSNSVSSDGVIRIGRQYYGDDSIIWDTPLASNRWTYIDVAEEAYSQDNPGWRNLRGVSSDVGGPFFVYRMKTEAVGEVRDYTQSWDRGQYTEWYQAKGIPMPVYPSLLEWPNPIHSSEYDMNRMGAEAVAKAAPGTSPMNLAVTLGELKKEGLPSIVGSTLRQRSSVAKKAGDEYLNAQFGWAPLVRDVFNLANTLTKSEKILAQLERDAGRKVRRKVTLMDITDNSTTHMGHRNTSVSGCADGFTAGVLYPSGNVIRTEERRRKVWFSGAFTYYLPPSYYSRNAIARGAAKANQLYGLELNPTTLWNLAPWSWAADWFSNAGDVISNTQRFLSEGLVMHHGYLMEHTVHSYTYAQLNGSTPPIKLTLETKGRVKANPFGFGVDFSDLSGFQTSILVALGLSRGR